MTHHRQEHLFAPPATTTRETARRKLWRQRRRQQEASGKQFTPVGVHRGLLNKPLEKAIDVFGWMLRQTPFHGRGYRNAHTIVRRDYVLECPDLPAAFDGYRILHLTDLHIDATPDLAQAIGDAVSGIDVDLCVMTGDYRLADDGPHDQIVAPMSDMLARIKPEDGTYAVLGNHDDHAMADTFEAQLNVGVLINESVDVHRCGQTITLTGIDDVNRFYTTDARDALENKVDGFGVALAHSPEMAHEAANGGHDLYLCGHTHGGQIALPGGQPVITHLCRNKDLARGAWQVGQMSGYTNAGAGFSGLPIRFNTRGEVAVFTLKRSAMQTETNALTLT